MDDCTQDLIEIYGFDWFLEWVSRWNLQKIENFIMVVRHGGVTEAARRIGMSQPALTASLRGLEKDLGFDLFDRGNGFVLTALGREFLPRAEEALSQIGDLEREVGLVRSGDCGELRIACGPAVADGMVGRALGRMMRETGGVRVEASVVGYPQFVELLERREVDLSVGALAAFEGKEEIETIPLEPQEVVFYCRAGHPLAKKKRVNAEEFFSYPHVAGELPQPILAWLDAQRPKNPASNGLSVTCCHYALLQQVVEQSDSISGAPRSVVRAGLESGRLAVVRFVAEPIFNRTCVGYLKKRRPTPLAERLIEELKKVAKEG